VLHKIEAVLPSDLSDKVDQTLLYSPNFQVRAELKRCVDVLNAAASDREFTEFSYRREDGEESQRRVRPLGLYFWDGVWTLASWREIERFRILRQHRRKLAWDNVSRILHAHDVSNFLEEDFWLPASIRDVDDGHPNGVNLRKRKSVVDICSSHPYLWSDSAKRRMKCFLASHPRGLLLADFPNNFRSVFRASGCPPRAGRLISPSQQRGIA
jgi:hypothetical protein